jgi:hypothetical protein
LGAKVLSSEIPKPVPLFVGVFLPIALDAFESFPFLLEKLWNTQFFATPAFATWPQGLSLLKDKLQAVGLLAIGVALELMPSDETARSSVRANSVDKGAATTGAGDKILFPDLMSLAATHP